MAVRKVLHFFSILMAVASSACFTMNLRPQIDVGDYRGDGRASQIRSAENPGFKVDFDAFSLAKPFRAEYRLDGMPPLHLPDFFEAGLVVKLSESEDSLWPQIPATLLTGSLGTLAIKLQDAAGHLILEGSVDIQALSWHRFIGDNPFGSNHSVWFRRFEKGKVPEEPWSLVASYSPGADSVDRFANIGLSAGGYR